MAKLQDSQALPRLGDSSALTKLGGESGPLPKLGQNFTFGEKLGGFALSTVESFPELFGIEPTESTSSFRAANPVSGFLSQAVGAFVPYLGAAKVARAAPVLGSGIAAAEALGGSSTIARGALGALAETAVVETGRVGLGASPIPEAIYSGLTGRDPETRDLGTLAGEGLFNVAGAGVLGGAIGGLVGRFAKGPRLRDTVPGYSDDAPLSVKARQLNELVKKAQDPADPFAADDAFVSRWARERDQLIRFNLQDVVPAVTDTGESVRSGKYGRDIGRSFRSLVGDKKDEIAPFLDRAAVWRGKNPDKLTTTRRLIQDAEGGYSTERELAEDLNAIGKSREELGLFAQDIRTIEVRRGQGKQSKTPAPVLEGEGGALDGSRLLSQPPVSNAPSTPEVAQSRASALQRRFTNAKVFSDVGDGWRMGKEKDGLYVMVKKIRGESEPSPGDRWAFLRTDSPGEFAQHAQRSNDVLMRSAYFPRPEELEKIGEPLFDAGGAMWKDFSRNLPGQKASKKLGPVGAMARDSLETIATYGAPSDPLSRRNPLFAAGFQLMKGLEAVADGRVDQLMHGDRQLVAGKSLARQVLDLDPPASGGLAGKIKELSKDDLTDIRSVLELEVPFEQVEAANQRGIFSDRATDFLRAMQAISDNFSSRVSKVGEAVQTNEAIKMTAEFQARRGHYAMTREFPGAYRVFLTDEAGEVAGIASGKSPLEAKEAATEIIKKQAERGKVLYEGGFVDEALRNPEELQKLKSKVLRPGFLKNRGDLLGYELQRGEMTTSKLTDLVEKNLKRRENYLRNVVMQEKLGEPLGELHRTAPQDAVALEKILRRYNGDEGEFARVQNALVDKALHSVGFGGKDSASAIVNATQKVLNSFQFNFGNITQPILNAIGTFQTILPEISYVVNASDDALARHYVTMPLMDSANNVRGSMGVLSEWKLFGNSMKMLGTDLGQQPQDFQALIKDMIKQGVIAPKYAESEFGANGAILKNATEGFRDTGSFIKLMNSANELLMSKSEELNRTLATATAYQLAQLRGMNYPQMVNFTREFLAKTAFNYGTVDRASVFTTPLGSLMGTFKNWMFHYMANMVRYSTSGKEALPALFWQTGATAVIGGLSATPFITPIADGASKWLTDKTWMQNLYDSVGPDNEWVADGIMYGLPGSMGISFASQASSPGSDPERDASMIFSFAAMSRMKSLTAGTKDALVAYRATGISPWEDPRVRGELVKALAPRTIYRAMSLTQDMGIKSMASGYDVTGSLGLGGAAMYAAGFNPTELDKTYEVYNSIRNSQEEKRTMMGQLGANLADAWESGDDRLATRVFTRAMAMGLDSSSVLRSAQARTARAQETQLEFQAKPEDEAAYGFMFED